jgi:hypothetical protein
MKIIYAFILLATAVGVVADKPRKGGERNPIPQQGFADLAALNEWSGTSSFGGGGMQKLTLGSQDIYYTNRMVTSGLPSTEIVFWKQIKGRFVPCLIMPVRMGAYSATVVGEEIVLKRHLRSDSIEIMRVRSEFFSDDFYVQAK